MTLTDSDLSRMRAEAALFLPGTAVIQGGTLTSDGGGGYTAAYASRGTVPCRVAPLTGGEVLRGGAISAEAEVLITLPALTEIETDDQIVVGDATYNVVRVREQSWETTRRVEAKEVE